MAVIGRGEKKFRIPIILRDNYFLYGKLVPPPKKLNIPWDQLTENYGSVLGDAFPRNFLLTCHRVAFFGYVFQLCIANRDGRVEVGGWRLEYFFWYDPCKTLKNFFSLPRLITDDFALSAYIKFISDNRTHRSRPNSRCKKL